MKWFACMIFASIIALSLSSSASAATCGERLFGDLTMTKDLICTLDGLEIGKDDITIDCNNHQIVGRNGFSGIEADGKKGITIKNCLIRGFARGIYLKDTTDSFITASEIRNNENGIELRNSEQISARENQLLGNNIGIGAYSSKDITIQSNLFRDNERGIVRYFYTNVNIEGNTYELNTEDVYDFNEVIPGEEPEPVEIGPTDEPEEEIEEEPEITETPMTTEELLTEAIYLEYRVEDINEELINKKLEELGKTSEELEIKRDITYEDGKTHIKLTIIPKKKFKNVEIYEKIPKCFAMYVDLIVFERPPEVLVEDPLIKWHFEELDVPAELVYSTAELMPKECEDLFQVIGLGEIIKPQRWWYALVVIILVAAIVIYFARFSKK